MEDIKRRDTQVFVKRLFSPGLLIVAFALMMTTTMVARFDPIKTIVGLCLTAGIAAFHGRRAYLQSIDDRFHDPRLRDQWKHCEDRVKRLNASLKELRKANIADLEELPKNVDRLAAELYVALRRADLVMFETHKSEGRLTQPKTVTLPNLPDKQAQDLLRQADRNIAEYNAHMQKLMGTVQRTEAQVMVFITTLDSLRARMLHYKASPRPAEVDNQEFMAAIREAKMQFDAIDMALEEIDAPLASGIRHEQSPPPVPSHIAPPEHDQQEERL